MAMFKPTVYLDFNADNIQEVRVGRTDIIQNADEKREDYYVYIDKRKIQKIIDYLRNMKLAEATRDELPNKSADFSIGVINNNGEVVIGMAIYGQSFIEVMADKKLYRSKKDWIIEGIEKMEFD